MDEGLQEALVEAGLSLREADDGLRLEDGSLSLRADFADMKRRIASGRVNRELLVKAARLKGFEGTPKLVDATAGLGQDALLLAAAGFDVQLYERNPVIAALLEDAVSRAREDPDLRDAASRMHVRADDSVQALMNATTSPDVVYLDPMFPERKKSAAVKKKFQLLQRLEAPCDDVDGILRAAMHADPRKIVIKRPLKGPCLAGIAPDFSLRGKAIRYDCIVRP